MDVGILTTSTQIQYQDLSQCLKSTSRFASTIYENICTGGSYEVAHGFWDYVLGFGLLGIVVAFILMVSFAFLG